MKGTFETRRGSSIQFTSEEVENPQSGHVGRYRTRRGDEEWTHRGCRGSPSRNSRLKGRHRIFNRKNQELSIHNILEITSLPYLIYLLTLLTYFPCFSSRFTKFLLILFFFFFHTFFICLVDGRPTVVMKHLILHQIFKPLSLVFSFDRVVSPLIGVYVHKLFEDTSLVSQSTTRNPLFPIHRTRNWPTSDNLSSYELLTTKTCGLRLRFVVPTTAVKYSLTISPSKNRDSTVKLTTGNRYKTLRV